jgi:hypothetical protein
VYKWFQKTPDTDEWTEIVGVNTKDITIADDLLYLKDKQVRCSVTPYCNSDVNGGAGVEVFSQNIKKPERKPVVTNLKLEKARVYLNETITALYDYYDENSDEEVGSDIIWYQSSSPDFSNPAEIGRGLDFNVTSDYSGKYIRFSITPKNNGNANKVGDIKYSTIYGPVTENSFTSTGYLLNEDYNDGTVGAWTVLNPGKGIIESISQGGGNYAIAHTPTGGGSGLETGCVATRPLNNGSGYAFDNGKTFVIETRLKQTDHSKGLYFKLNTKWGYIMNFIYIHTHDSGREMEPYGVATHNPSLMKLAKESIMFRNAHCVAPTCSPSRAAMLTGMTAHNSGMYGLAHRGFSLNDYSQHLAQFLGRNGYYTALIGVQHEAKDPSVLGYMETHADHVKKGKPAIVSDKSSLDIAFEFLERKPYEDKPFFLSFGLRSTHRKFMDADDSRDGFDRNARYDLRKVR